MEYTEAVSTVTAHLAAGGDEYAPAAAIYLALQACRHLGDTDPVWDRLGLDVLAVHSELYADQSVMVETTAPADSPATRAAVAALLEQLAQHHQRLAAGEGPHAVRLAHDAGAEQLRSTAAALV